MNDIDSIQQDPQTTIFILKNQLNEKCCQLQDKCAQIKELQRDKADLRADKERSVLELTRLVDELKAKERERERALADVSRLSAEVTAVRMECDYFREAHGAHSAHRVASRVPSAHQPVLPCHPFGTRTTFLSSPQEIEGEPTTGKRKRHDEVQTSVRKRGRPRKAQFLDVSERDRDEPVVKRKRGRPRKVREDFPTEQASSTPKRRGRPPKIRASCLRPSMANVAANTNNNQEAASMGVAARGAGSNSRNSEGPEARAYSSPAAKTSSLKPQNHLQSLPSSLIDSDKAFIFDEIDLLSILSDTPDVVIEPPYDRTAPTRQFLHLTYEGNPFQSVQFIKKNPLGESQRMFIFPNHEKNPTLPFLPGQSGIVIDDRYFRTNAVLLQPWSLFRKVSLNVSGVNATWLYLGEYEFLSGGKMSADVFNCQKHEVKQNWARELLSQKRSPNEAHLGMRARIGLRKAGVLRPHIPISKEDLEELVEEEIEEMKAGRGRQISTEDVVAAFASGDEAIDITILRCVSYDRTLAKDIATKFAAYVSNESKYAGQPATARRGPRQTTPTSATAAKITTDTGKLQTPVAYLTRYAKGKALENAVSSHGQLSDSKDGHGESGDDDSWESDNSDEGSDDNEEIGGNGDDLSYTSEDVNTVSGKLA